jgi:crotonobetainyl-CoA:carnitine CoA-transferase CaiB-like acyl-CoA transferase
MVDRKSSAVMEGVTVVEAASTIAGPLLGGLLGDYGARVIKVESPGEGDFARRGRYLFEFFSRNKESVTCKLSTPEGAGLFKALIARADILVEGFRPGVFESWGLSYRELSEINPGLIMVRISGFGQTGPYASQPGYGRLAEAMSGFHYATGYPDGPPMSPGIPVADVMAGYCGAAAASMALYNRATGRDGGTGKEIDISLCGPMLYQFGAGLLETAETGEAIERRGHELAARPSAAKGRSLGALLQAKDGKWMIYSAASPRFNAVVEEFLGVASDDRGVLSDSLAAWVTERTRDEALDTLRKIGMPCAPIYKSTEILDDPHFAERGEFTEVVGRDGQATRMVAGPFRVNGESGAVRAPAPDLGEHNHSVYHDWLRIPADNLAALASKGVI